MKESEKLMSLKLSDLQLVSELARHRSIRAVARNREIEPSQISRSIQRIEKHYGEKLFRRSQGGVLPLAEANHIAEFYDTQLKNLFSSRESNTRELIIGAPSFLASYLVARSLSRILRTATDLDFKVMEIAPETIAREGIRGALDVVVHMEKIDWPRTWESRPVGDMYYDLYGGKRSYGKVRLHSADVRELEFIYPVYSVNDELVFGKDYCPLNVNRRIRKLGTATAEAAVNALEDSDCVAFLPHVVAQPRLKDGGIRRLQVSDWPEISRPVLLSYHSEKVTAKFINELSVDIEKTLKRN